MGNPMANNLVVWLGQKLEELPRELQRNCWDPRVSGNLGTQHGGHELGLLLGWQSVVLTDLQWMEHHPTPVCRWLSLRVSVFHHRQGNSVLAMLFY